MYYFHALVFIPLSSSVVLFAGLSHKIPLLYIRISGMIYVHSYFCLHLHFSISVLLNTALLFNLPYKERSIQVEVALIESQRKSQTFKKILTLVNIYGENEFIYLKKCLTDIVPMQLLYQIWFRRQTIQCNGYQQTQKRVSQITNSRIYNKPLFNLCSTYQWVQILKYLSFYVSFRCHKSSATLNEHFGQNTTSWFVENAVDRPGKCRSQLILTLPMSFF